MTTLTLTLQRTLRLEKEKQSRPLLANLSTDELYEFIAKHLFDRNYYYNQASFKVSVDSKSLEDIVEEISMLLV